MTPRGTPAECPFFVQRCQIGLILLLTVVLPLSLAFIMLVLGMGLRPADFARVARMPLAYGIGLACQAILLPATAFALLWLLPTTPELAVGVMILACAPGGPTSNVLARLGGGNVALSISLTAGASLLTIVTVPLIVALAMRSFLGSDVPPLDVTRLALTMFALTAVPVAAGLGLRAAFPTAIDRVEPAFAILAIVLFAVIVLAAIALNWGLLLANIATLGPILAALIVVMLSFGFGIARLSGLPRADATAIALEAGIQNGTLGITVGALVSGTDGLGPFSLASGVYGILMYVVCVPLALWLRRAARPHVT